MEIPYVAFDLEIAGDIDPESGVQPDEQADGISCAATYTSKGELVAWNGPMVGDRFAEKMRPCDCDSLVQYLLMVHQTEVPIVTWNGLGFDFKMLAREVSEDKPHLRLACAKLALTHVDMAWAMFCDKGYMCGLSAASEGMGLEGKLEGVSGVDAPEMWKGDVNEQLRVIKYVKQDAKLTGELYESIVTMRKLIWVTKAGKVTKSPWYPRLVLEKHGGRAALASVAVMAQSPVPDNKWMDDPWPRSKFIGWAYEVVEQAEREKHGLRPH